MNECWTWQDGCTKACQLLNSFGMKQASFCKTVSNWSIAFRTYKIFSRPNLSFSVENTPSLAYSKCIPVQSSKLFHLASRIQSIYQLKQCINSFFQQWSRDLPICGERNHLMLPLVVPLATLLPKTNENDGVISLFLRAHRLKNSSFSTSWRWMQLLGFDYENRRKSYYVDCHKREVVVAY